MTDLILQYSHLLVFYETIFSDCLVILIDYLIQLYYLITRKTYYNM